MHDVTIRKKAMISQPMNGLTHEEIQVKREKVAIKLERMGYEWLEANNFTKGIWR